MSTQPTGVMRALLCIFVPVVALAATACTGSGTSSRGLGATSSTAQPPSGSPVGIAGPGACRTPRVHYRPYPGDALGLGGIPWVRGEPADTGPIALLWYWPSSWTRNRMRVARIFTGGVAPAGYNVKILWTFLAPEAREKGGRDLMIRGHQMDGSGSFQAGPFSAIDDAGQRGAPAYASIIDVPQSGCWRLSLWSRGLEAQFDLWAVHRAGSSR
jgi:hypothetical protein